MEMLIAIAALLCVSLGRHACIVDKSLTAVSCIAGCDNMTCCIVLLNPAATAASLPPLTSKHSSEQSSATTGLLSQSNSEQTMQRTEDAQHKSASSEDDLPTSPGLNMSAQATAVP